MGMLIDARRNSFSWELFLVESGTGSGGGGITRIVSVVKDRVPTCTDCVGALRYTRRTRVCKMRVHACVRACIRWMTGGQGRYKDTSLHMYARLRAHQRAAGYICGCVYGWYYFFFFFFSFFSFNTETYLDLYRSFLDDRNANWKMEGEKRTNNVRADGNIVAASFFFFFWWRKYFWRCAGVFAKNTREIHVDPEGDRGSSSSRHSRESGPSATTSRNTYGCIA